MSQSLVDSPTEDVGAQTEFVTDWQLPANSGSAEHPPPNGPPKRDVVVQLMPACDAAVMRLRTSQFPSGGDVELQRTRSEILALANQVGSSLIAIDLTKVTFGAAFLGMAVLLNQQLAAHGRRLCVVGDEHGLFQVTCLDQLIPRYDDLSDMESQEIRQTRSKDRLF